MSISLAPRCRRSRWTTGPYGVSIVLPCHNEEANVAAAVRMACRAGRMNALAFEVIVVDDGSRDGTNAVATRLAAGDPHVHVVAHPRNRGYGAALRTGIAAAQQPWVLLTDADLQFDLVDLAGFVPLAADHDLIAGYRRVRKLLSGQHTQENRIPDVQVVRYDRDGDRSLTLRHQCRRGRPLTDNAAQVVAHLKRLWGFTVRLETWEDEHRIGDVVECRA